MRTSACVVAALLAATVTVAAPDFSFDGRTLTISTDRYVVTWRDGCCVGLRTLLPEQTVIADVGGPMTLDLLPAGVGSFYEQEEATRARHHPWNFADLDTRFPAQHPPGAGSDVRAEDIRGGVRLTYTRLAGEPGATLVQELVVEPATGDLLIRQRAQSTNPGIFGISFSLPNLDPDITLAMPYFGGQRWGRRFTQGRLIGLAYTQFWAAGLVIGELPGGGSFIVWAEDPHMRPKYLFCRHQGDAQGLAFEALPESPYYGRTEAEVFTWRLNTYPGNWMQPAQRFKQWFVKAHDLVPRNQRGSKWVDEIALIWPKYISEDLMGQMSAVFPPEKTLMMQWGWLPGFNRRVPEYIPKSEDFADQVKLAHGLGYRIGGYTSEGLIDIETHPALVAEMGVGYKQDEPWRAFEGPDDKPDRWLWYIHPGSEKWRDFYAGKMRWVYDTWGLDYLYQDVSGCGIGSSGLVGGLGYHEAMVACETAIRRRVPEAAIGGEFWTEVNACREDFAVASFLAWKAGGQWEGDLDHAGVISLPDQPHPLMGYLFNDYCIRYPHNVPIRDTRKFHMAENINEVTGAVAIFTTDPDDTTSEARVVLERARLWSEGFRNWYPEQWEPDVVAYLRNPGGRVIKYVRPDASTWCRERTGGGDRLIYARVTGHDRLAPGEPVRIDGWACCDSDGPIGLSPQSWYCVFPGQPQDTPAVVTSLPEGARVTDTRISDEYVMLALDGDGAGELRWKCDRAPVSVAVGSQALAADATSAAAQLPTDLLVAFAAPAEVALGEPLPLGEWEQRIQSSGLFVKPAAPFGVGKREIEGEEHSGPHVFPPLGGPGSEHCIDGFVRLPDDPNLALRFFAGQTGKIGDGVHFVVRVNGREVFRHFRKTGPGWEELTAPLGEFAGQAVVLTLGLDAGPSGFNTSCDDSWWGDAALVAQ